MRYIQNTRTDPAFNLAAEEWLLRQTTTDVFMLWQNARAVIVGRNQNTLAQIDEAYVRGRNIPVVRRLSGGGAVFHDLGNINFTFLSLGNADRDLDFRRFTAPIIAALAAMGVSCAFEGRNDLAIDGKKISGNAQYVLRDRVLHHGTLLFSADMTDLSGALRIDTAKYQDKAVKSVAKRVTNIAAHLPEPMDAATFISRLMDHVSGGAPRGQASLTAAEQQAIGLLADRKYRSWEWNYGYSPDYAFTRTSRTPGGVLEVHLDTARGEVTAIRILGDYFGRCDIAELEAQLVGCRHNREALTARLAGVPLGKYLRDVDAPTFVECLF
jgi:lipoate-protein ligase A